MYTSDYHFHLELDPTPVTLEHQRKTRDVITETRAVINRDLKALQ